VQDYVLDIGELIDSVDSYSFLKMSAALIGNLSQASQSTIFVYTKDQTPLYVFDSFKRQKHKDAIRTFINHTYIINPFYRKCTNGIRAGIYLAKDVYNPNDNEVKELVQSMELAVEHSDHEELGYVTCNWPKRQSEMSIAIPLDDRRVIEITLYRDADCASFEEEFPTGLANMYPILRACFRRFWARNEHRFRNSECVEAGGFAPLLSPREREVIGLILKGHSSEAISLILGISITTVKSHRKMSYQKMKISTQAELMSYYLSSLPQLMQRPVRAH